MRKPWIAIAALLMLATGCPSTPPPNSGVVAHLAALNGRVDFGARNVQAVMADVANGATVSLIDTTTGLTVASTVTNPDGTFSLSFSSGFRPVSGKPYFLEAVKGLAVGGQANRAGASVARVRTLVFSQFGGWLSLNNRVPGASLVINTATTTVSAIVGLRNVSVADQLNLAGRVTGSTFDAAGAAIGSGDFDSAYPLVASAIAADQDPLEAISYAPASGTYALKPGSLLLFAATLPPKNPGDPVTFYGQGLPSAGGSASIAIAGLPITSWTVDASRSALTLTLPGNATGGRLMITSGTSTWIGPYVPVRGTVGTYAGSGVIGWVDAKGTFASFNQPQCLAWDNRGNLFVGEDAGYVVRKIAPDGMVTTLAGSGVAGYLNGTASQAQFKGATGMAWDGADTLYLADDANARIRTISISSGTVGTLAGGSAGNLDAPTGPGTSAKFNYPRGLCVDGSGNLYVADSSNNKIRKVVLATGAVTTFAGPSTTATGSTDGASSSARFYGPRGVTWDGASSLYVSDTTNNLIRKIDLPSGTVSTVAGSSSPGNVDGASSSARFTGPRHLVVTSDRTTLYVADDGNHSIRKIDLPSGNVSTLAGSLWAGQPVNGYKDGPLLASEFNLPYSLALDAFGNLYVAEEGGNRIRVITP